MLTLMTTAGCNHRSAVDKKMDMADSLMTSKPNSALAILEGIPASDINGKETSARYALLKSMALDKNYVDTTTFDVLQPAIDYYIENGTPDEQLRTYYYQGRIYQNRCTKQEQKPMLAWDMPCKKEEDEVNKGDDAAAMQCFMNAIDLKQKVTDSLLLAHTLVAQGTLYLKQYKVREFIHSNMEAMRIYGAIGKKMLEIKSCSNAIDGFIIADDKFAADSLISICSGLVKENTEGEAYLFSSLLSYIVTFGKPEEIRAFLDEHQDVEMSKDDAMDFAYGYSRIGEYDKAEKVLSGINIDCSILDSLKLASVEIDIFEQQGNYELALKRYKDFSAMLGRYQSNLLSHDLLFSDKKHQLEIEKLMEIKERDRIIWITLCGIFSLVILVGLLYYRSYHNKTKRILAEKDNENLRLEQANLKLEIAQLEGERDNLKELQKVQSELAAPIQDVINNRLDMLNALLAKEITHNESYAEPYNKWIETVHNDKKQFMDSTRLAFKASHPKFMEYLEHHGLSNDEINYLCLYAIGLRGKEVGEYIQMKRHYVISHEIRLKLGINEHETNLGLYIRRLMTQISEVVKRR